MLNLARSVWLLPLGMGVLLVGCSYDFSALEGSRIDAGVVGPPISPAGPPATSGAPGGGGSPAGSGGATGAVAAPASGGASGSGGAAASSDPDGGDGGGGTGPGGDVGGDVGSGGAAVGSAGATASGGGTAGGSNAGGTPGAAGSGGAGPGGGAGSAGSAGSDSDSSHYNFEASVQGWGRGLGSGFFTDISTSTTHAFAGRSALAAVVTASPTATTYILEVAPPVPAVPAGATVTFHLYVPRAAVLTGVQPYALGSAPGYLFFGGIVLPAQLTRDGWTTLRVMVPADAPAIIRMGVRFQSAGAWTDTVYVDSIDW